MSEINFLPEVAVPSAPRLLQWSMDSGYLVMTFPAEMSVEEVAEVEQVLALTVGVMRRMAEAQAASAIEAASAGETAKTGSTEGESAVPKADAQ